MLFSFEGVDCSGKDVMAERFALMNNYNTIPDVSPIIKELGIKNRNKVDIVVRTQLHLLDNMAQLHEKYVIVRGYLTSIVYDKFHKGEYNVSQYDTMKSLINEGKLVLFYVVADDIDLKERWAEREKHYKQKELLKIKKIYEEVLEQMYKDDISFYKIRLYDNSLT